MFCLLDETIREETKDLKKDGRWLEERNYFRKNYVRWFILFLQKFETALIKQQI